MRSSTLSIVICLMVVALAAPCFASEVYEGEQALEMMRKMYCGTVEEGKMRFGTWEGSAYSRVQGEKDRHLFNVIGFSTFELEDLPDSLVTNLTERYPLYLTPPPLDDTRPNETSWTVFKKHLESRDAE